MFNVERDLVDLTSWCLICLHIIWTISYNLACQLIDAIISLNINLAIVPSFVVITYIARIHTHTDLNLE